MAQIEDVIKSFEQGILTVADISFASLTGWLAEQKLREGCALVNRIQQRLMATDLSAFQKTGSACGYPSCIILEEAHEFAGSTSSIIEQDNLFKLYDISTREYRKYGLDHLFIDQSLKGISEELQIQSYFMGERWLQSI